MQLLKSYLRLGPTFGLSQSGSVEIDGFRISAVASLGRQIGARIVIPCHYEIFAFNTASVDDFVVSAQEIAQSYHVLRCGER